MSISWYRTVNYHFISWDTGVATKNKTGKRKHSTKAVGHLPLMISLELHLHKNVTTTQNVHFQLSPIFSYVLSITSKKYFDKI